MLITDGRMPVGVRLPSERELTDAARGQPHHRRPRLRRAARPGLPGRRARARAASPACPRRAASAATTCCTPSELDDDKIDLTCAAPVPGPGLLAGLPARGRRDAALPLRERLLPLGPAGAARGRRASGTPRAGLPTTPDQIMIVPGAMTGLAVVARALVRRGARTLVESPTYPNGIATLRHSGARLVSSDVGREDAGVDALLDVVRQVGPALALLIPDFHNPTGHLMADASRERVAARARPGGHRAGDRRVDGRPAAGRPGDAGAVRGVLPGGGDGRIAEQAVLGRHPGRLGPGTRPMMDTLFRSRLSLDLGTPLLEQLVALRPPRARRVAARATGAPSCAPPATPPSRPWPSTCRSGRCASPAAA